jgi:hypothetical protein
VDVVPRVVVSTPKDILPPLATPPDPVHASSIQGGFDPREHPATWSKREAPSDVRVVGDGDGLRVGRAVKGVSR